MQFNPVVLRLGHIKDIVNQSQQETGRSTDFFKAVGSFLRIAFFFCQIGHTDNPVQRCPDIMTHP